MWRYCIIIFVIIGSMVSVSEAILGDLDRDGDVDVQDFLIFVENFGKTGPVEPTGDNRISDIELECLRLMGYWSFFRKGEEKTYGQYEYYLFGDFHSKFFTDGHWSRDGVFLIGVSHRGDNTILAKSYRETTKRFFYKLLSKDFFWEFDLEPNYYGNIADRVQGTIKGVGRKVYRDASSEYVAAVTDTFTISEESGKFFRGGWTTAWGYSEEEWFPPYTTKRAITVLDEEALQQIRELDKLRTNQ